MNSPKLSRHNKQQQKKSLKERNNQPPHEIQPALTVYYLKFAKKNSCL